MHLLVVVSFALLAMVCGFKPMRDSQIGPRRRFILWESGLTSNQPSSPLQNQKEKNKVLLSSTILASLALIPEATKAARGAFEMDAEVYLRSLIGQRPNAVFQRPIFPSPRTINKDFAESVLKILLETISEISGKSPIAIQRAVEANLPYSIKYFQTFLPIKDKSSVQDQYYFDIYLYNCYLEVAKLIPKPDDRVGLQKQFGRKLLHMIYTDYLHDPNSEKISKISSRIDLSLRRLLNVFFETGMIGGFRLADEKLRDEEELNAFASDEDYTLNFDVTIEQPVCLISFLEQSAASSLFHPNIVAYVLQAYLESPGIKASFDDYLFDNYYKENNFNPQAQDILITYTLSRS